MSSLFSKIVSGDIPCYKVYENDEFLAFLDIQPITKGHVLVIPKLEIDYIFDLEDDLLSRMMLFSKVVSQMIKRAYNPKKVGVSVIGLEVPHAHIHLMPINSLMDMDFTKQKLILDSDELQEIAEKIKNS
jgi:histidine triad (HIT) family protein